MKFKKNCVGGGYHLILEPHLSMFLHAKFSNKLNFLGTVMSSTLTLPDFKFTIANRVPVRGCENSFEVSWIYTWHDLCAFYFCFNLSKMMWNVYSKKKGIYQKTFL